MRSRSPAWLPWSSSSPSVAPKWTGPPAISRGGPVGGVVKRLSPSVSCVHERRDREPVVGDARLLALVEVPALLAREARARQRRLGRVLELHIDHHDRRDEAHLVGV